MTEAPVARNQFLDKTLLYLFSYNAEVDPYTLRIGVVPEGVRFNVSGTPDESRVYHVLREKTQAGFGPGFKVITGRIRVGSDRALYRTDDVVVDEVRLTIETDDGALINARYHGSAYLGAGGYDAYVAGIDRVGRFRNPAYAPIVIAPRFETLHQDYKWISKHQCVGFGLAEVIKSQIRRITYDVYAMT
jgi:hypothetical protein